MMKFDDVLTELNGFGRFQIKTMVLLLFARMTLPFNFLLNNFIAAVPSHHCNISSLDDGGVFSNLSLDDRITVSIPLQQDRSPSSCKVFTQPEYHLLLNSSNSTEPLQTVSCSNGWMYDHTTFSSTLVTEWDLVCDNKRLSRVIVTIFFIGVMVGAAIFGYLSDRFGRKKALLVSYIITTVFGFASTLSHNIEMFAAMRFFTGVGLSGISIISFVISIEWTSIKRRSAMCVILSTDWTLFTMILAAIAYFVTDWRHLTAVVTSPLLLAIITWWWLPESARWLMTHGNVEGAQFYLIKCAKVNKREKFIADLTPEVLNKVILVGEEKNETYSSLDLLKTPRMRKVSLLLGIVWLSVACSYYGIGLNVAGFGVNIYLTQFIFGATELPAKIFIFFTLDKIGRKLNQAGMLSLAVLCLFSNIFIPIGAFRTAVGALGKMFVEGAFTSLYLFSAELYPTVMRQTGMGFCSFIARIGVSVSPLIQLLEEVWVHLPSVVFLFLALSAAVSTCFLPETNNTCLPETIKDVEQRR